MYGKVFESIYDGSLYGQWEAIITMQTLIVICDADGVVDMTPPAIAGKTSIPLKHILNGLKILSEPDPYSRTEGDDGVRIRLIDDHRNWGWYLVNHKKYLELQDADTVRAQTRARVQKHRNKRNGGNGDVTVGNGQKRYIDIDIDKDIDIKKKKTRARFTPPTVSQVKKFTAEKNLRLDAVPFVNFYQSKNWMVGKNKMKDWKAAAIGWASRDKPKPKTPLPIKQYNADGTERT